jgi:tRNA threonylcarbamoyladenosine biosynthesis protein TsaB
MEAFAAAHAKPGVGISTLEALAWRSRIHGKWIAPTIDARRGEVYGAVYRRDGDLLTELQKPAVMSPERWFKSMPDAEILFCGDGAIRYAGFINRREWSSMDVDLYLASTLAELAVKPGAGSLSPLYVRRTEAEVNRERQDESITSPNSKS